MCKIKITYREYTKLFHDSKFRDKLYKNSRENSRVTNNTKSSLNTNPYIFSQQITKIKCQNHRSMRKFWPKYCLDYHLGV